MSEINIFLAMGGYGIFVWLAYGISLSALVLLVWRSLSFHKQIESKLAAQDVIANSGGR